MVVADLKMEHEVDFVINVFERTYRSTLAPGIIRAIVDSNKRDFRRIIVLINNVKDPVEASSLGKLLMDAGEIDNFYFISDLLEAALVELGLSHNDINPLPYYSDWAFVAMVLPDSVAFSLSLGCRSYPERARRLDFASHRNDEERFQNCCRKSQLDEKWLGERDAV